MIPRTVHRIWLGGDIPAMYDHADSFSAHHPEWRHRLWTDADLDGEWITRDLLDQAEEYSPDDAVRFRVDVLRIEILARHGGIYVDCDAVCLRPMDDLLLHGAFVAQSPNDPTKATNAVMGCEPGHPFMASLLEGLAERADLYRGHQVAESVGGHYLSALLESHEVVMLPWWLFAARSIQDRKNGRPRDPRNVAKGFVDHFYGHTMRDERMWVPSWARRMRATFRQWRQTSAARTR